MPELDKALESLWGIESRLQERRRPPGYVKRPLGFHVVEPRPRIPTGRGWTWYLVYRVGMDSRRSLKTLIRLAGSRQGGLLGLKDACAHVFQYMALEGENLPPILEARGLRAWRVGLGGPPRLGLHGYNIFRITLTLMTGARVTWKSLSGIPGFYGPQRFGITRPNTHYLGLLHVEARLGEVLREYRFRYPLEERAGPGGYEAQELARARPGMLRPRPLRIMLEALQSYLFNRALSRALKATRDYAEHHVEVECMSGRYRVPAARLPGPRLAHSRSRWARLVAEIMKEEGLPWHALKGLRSPFRPLVYPVCGLRAREAEEGIMLRFALPRGAYATSLLRELVEVDWLRYEECSHLGGD